MKSRTHQHLSPQSWSGQILQVCCASPVTTRFFVSFSCSVHGPVGWPPVFFCRLLAQRLELSVCFQVPPHGICGCCFSLLDQELGAKGAQDLGAIHLREPPGGRLERQKLGHADASQGARRRLVTRRRRRSGVRAGSELWCGRLQRRWRRRGDKELSVQLHQALKKERLGRTRVSHRLADAPQRSLEGTG